MTVMEFFTQKRRRASVIIGALLFLALLGIVGIFRPEQKVVANNHTYVTVYYDGTQQTVATDATTIGELLERANIPVGKFDAVQPSRDTELIANDYNVNIYRARPVTVVDNGQRHSLLTAAQSPKEIAKAAEIKTYDEDEFAVERVDDFLTEGTLGLKMTIDRAVPVVIDLYGKTMNVRTQATTVGELLTEKGISIKEGDHLAPAGESEITEGMTIRLVRNGVDTVTVEEEIPFATETIRDADREVGFKEVREKGETGRKMVTYEVRLENGAEVERKEINSVTQTEPKTEVVVVGTKSAPVAGPEEIISRIEYWSNIKGIDANRVARIAKCESGFNPAASSGYYLGLFQHDPNYWPARAAKYGQEGASILDAEAQIIVSTSMMAEGGWHHWGCR